MKASIVDLRYHMKEILKALDRNEPVEILYRGNVTRCNYPQDQTSNQKTSFFWNG